MKQIYIVILIIVLAALMAVGVGWITVNGSILQTSPSIQQGHPFF